ncbi:MAG: hypothetical protein M3Q71_13890 [Chloroflexota bacterium]|nr:hypothetical protein [Chloroflexota bacterium]
MTDSNHLIPVTLAARRLRISEPTFRRRVREGSLTVYADPLDRRRKLVQMADVDRLAALDRLISAGGKGDA